MGKCLVGYVKKAPYKTMCAYTHNITTNKGKKYIYIYTYICRAQKKHERNI